MVRRRNRHHNRGGWQKKQTETVLDRHKLIHIACLNTNGWSGQTQHDVQSALDSRNIDVFSLTETKKRKHDKKIQLPGFQVFETRRDRGDKAGGGIACLVRETLGIGFCRLDPKIEKPDLQYVSKERLWVTYNSSEGKTAVASVYLGWNASDDRHLEWNMGILEVLEDEVRDLREKGYRVVLQGDFNSWVGSDLSRRGIPGNSPALPNANGDLFLNFLAVNNLTHVNGAVREAGDWASRLSRGLWTRHSPDHRSSTVLDYVVISNEHLDSVHDMLVDEEGVYGGGSDHNMLFTSLSDKFIAVRRNAPRPTPGWNFEEKTNFTKFRQVVAREVDKISDVGPGVDGLSSALTSSLLKGLNEGVGRRVVVPRGKAVFPKHIITLMKECRTLERKFKTLKCQFANARAQLPPASLLVARDLFNTKNEELESAKCRFKRQRRAPLLGLAKSKSRQDRKRFWSFVSRKAKTVGGIFSLKSKATGNLQHTPEGITEEVRQYLLTIFSGHEVDPSSLGNVDDNVEDPGGVHKEPHANQDHEYGFKTHARLPSTGDDPSCSPAWFLDRPFTIKEVKIIIENLKTGKAAGHDGIVNEALKEAPDSFVNRLTVLFNRVKDQSQVPRSWRRGRVTLVHKKGAMDDVGNYRPITVLTAMNATYSKLLNARLTEVVERHRLLGEVQNGFRKGRSGSDSAFVLNTVLWKSLAKRKKVHISFLDLQKAYDSVDRNILWAKMRKLGFGGKFLDSIISMYTGDYVTSDSGGITTEPVFLGRGLRQGCSLSPLLFALYIVDMSRDLVASNLGVSLKKFCITALFFADDIVLVSRTPEGLRTLHDIVLLHCSSLNMKLSVSKSKVMSCVKDVWELFDQQEIVGCLDKVIQFRYLGVQTSLLPSQAAREMHKRATSISVNYRNACLRIARDGPDIVDLASCLWLNVAIPSLFFGAETIRFTGKVLEDISKHQSSIAKFTLGLPSCSPNVSGAAILGLKPVKQILFSSQLKFYLKISKLNDDRWAKDALLDHLGGGWASPYIKLLTDIKDEVGMFRWPLSHSHIEAALAGHFLEETNDEIRRLSLPALEPLAKRARMQHVNESFESQVISGLLIFPLSRFSALINISLCTFVFRFLSFCYFHYYVPLSFCNLLFLKVLSQWIVDQPLLGHKSPLLGEDGWRDRLEWCPACRGLHQTPILMSSRHALYLTEFSFFLLCSLD